MMDAKFLHADNTDSDHTAWMRSLISVFTVRTSQKIRLLTLRSMFYRILKSPANTLIRPPLLLTVKSQ